MTADNRCDKFVKENNGIRIGFYTIANIAMLLAFWANFGINGLIGCVMGLVAGSYLLWHMCALPLIFLFMLEPQEVNQ